MEDLEQIMRRIHILFAKCEPYGNKEEGKIIVPKKEVFRLLEKLNFAVIHLMDEYEGTQESRERGMRDFYQEGEKIKAAAQSGADDVYAASLIYTDNMLEELSDVLADAKEELWEQYARMAERLDRQARVLGGDQEEIHQQLGAMAQSGKYLKLIERENARLKQAEQAHAKQEAVDEDAYMEEYWDEDGYDEEDEYGEYEEEGTKEETDGFETDIEIDAESDGEVFLDSGALAGGEPAQENGKTEKEAAGDGAKGMSAGSEAENEEGEDADGTADSGVHAANKNADADSGKGKTGANAGTDSAAAGGTFASSGAKRKSAVSAAAGRKLSPAAQNPQKKPAGRRRVSAGRHARMSSDLEAEWAEEEAKRKVRKIGTAIYQDVGEPYDPPAKHVTYEIKVNQAYLDMVGEGVDLDAEYYQWKEEQAQAAAGLETGKEEPVAVEEDDDIGAEVQILDNPGIQPDTDKKKKRGLKFGKRG